MKDTIQIVHCGIIPYKEAWDLQQQLLGSNVELKKNKMPTQHYLLLCEHPPVYTIGKTGSMQHMLINEQQLQEKNIEFYQTNRGGDITFHGYGQLVAYPILDLERVGTDIGKYLRALEESIIQILYHFGLQGERSAKETGVWLDPNIPERARKICAIGIKLSRWITMHGLAFNVSTDLQYFDFIIPCGIRNKAVTSLASELKRGVSLRGEIEPLFITFFCNQFTLESTTTTLSELHKTNSI